MSWLIRPPLFRTASAACASVDFEAERREANLIHMVAKPTVDRRIRTKPRPHCALCAGKGEFIYLKQTDRLFGAGGLWNLKKCSNRECGLIWLDPMPLEEDIGKAYANYYTHSARDATSRVGLLKRIYRVMKRGYLADKYGYQISPGPLAAGTIGKLLYLFPIRRSNVDAEVRFLPAMPQGRLLDVGCGSGEWLLAMRELGWQVEGIDSDEEAANVARQRGLGVRCGSLEQQSFSNDSFDAVTLNHVIEHVPDPIQTLIECGRILKRGGKLVICTPNSTSLGHRIFKENWRGLEPPRHLHLFSMQAILRLLELARFKRISIQPQASSFVIYETLLLHRGRTGSFRGLRRNWPAWVFTRLISGAELCLNKWDPSFAECMAAIAVKE